MPHRNTRSGFPTVLDLRDGTGLYPLGLRSFYGRSPPLLSNELLFALHKCLERLRCGDGLTLDIGIPGLNGQPVSRLATTTMTRRRLRRSTANGRTRGNVSRFDLRRFRPHPWGGFYIRRNVTDGGFLRPDLRWLRSGLWGRQHIRAGSTNSGFSGFDLRLPHPLPRRQPRPAAFRRFSAGATLPGGNSFLRLDSWPLLCGWIMGRGRICREL